MGELYLKEAREPHLQSWVHQCVRVCVCVGGMSEQFRGITLQSGVAAESGGRQFRRAQNCGELFEWRLQERLLKLGYT